MPNFWVKEIYGHRRHARDRFLLSCLGKAQHCGQIQGNRVLWELDVDPVADISARAAAGKLLIRVDPGYSEPYDKL